VLHVYLQVENITAGALVIAYPSGEPATLHMMSEKVLEKYWELWKERVFKFWCMEYKNRQQAAR